jgi:3-oxoacyl-[acyl-carrier protein] reductase
VLNGATRAIAFATPPLLADRVAVVTGASSGIGRATAECLAAAGASITLFARNRERLVETALRIRRSVDAEPLVVCGDVTSEADAARLAGETIERFGGIDVLVAAAGIGRAPGAAGLLPLPVAHTGTAHWDVIVKTNLTGTFLSNRAVLPAMLARGCGDIVNISSARAGLRGAPLASAYSASKFGVMGLSEALREEVAPYGIRVSVVLPDATVTPMISGPAGGQASRFGPAMPAERVAEVILYLVTRTGEAAHGATVILPWEIEGGR